LISTHEQFGNAATKLLYEELRSMMSLLFNAPTIATGGSDERLATMSATDDEPSIDSVCEPE
jgi:hypothetical protein